MNLDDKVAALAARIADGSAIDWPVDADSTDPDEDSIIEELKAIALLATRHRMPLGLISSETAREGTRWGPLTVTAPVGEGRFGQVYLAWDARLQRRVALKLLFATTPAAATSPVHAIEEARLLAKVRHPNVLAVHGAEYVDGHVGIWTEFIEGLTLEALLDQRGPMPPAEVAAIGLDLCRALGAVHDAGLLHRDIKAQNVMREIGGRIVLMDFGTGHDLDARPARAGDFSGTPLYLAPEILAGGRPTAASDVYSLSVLLFRLLTGAYPVSGKTFDDVRAGHREGRVMRLCDARPDLPPRLVAAIECGLAADPAKRHATAAAFESALQRVISPGTDVAASQKGVRAIRPPQWLLATGAAALIVLSSFLTWQWTLRHPRPVVVLGERDWVLVADFQNLTGESRFDDFGHYAVERELANSAFVRPIPSPRVEGVLRLMGRPAESTLEPGLAREVALRDGEVRLVINGQIARQGRGYAISAIVSSPQTGEALASVNEPARSPENLPAALSTLAIDLRALVGETPTAITASVRRLEAVTTPSFQALQTYTRAYDLGERGEWNASLALARQAVAEDPSFASARIWLAWTLRNTGLDAEARAAAREAMALSGGATAWEQYWIRGSAHSIAGEDDQAVAAYKALMELAPNHLWGVRNLGLLTGEAKYLLQRATALPNDMAAQFDAARVLYITGADVADVERYWTRGAELSTTAATGSFRRAPGVALLIPAMLRLDDGDPRAASQALTRALTGSGADDTQTRQRRLVDVFLLDLSMGQVEAGRQLLRQEGPWGPPRAMLLAVADFYAGRTIEARGALTRINFADLASVPFWTAPFWAMTRVGLSSQAEASLDTIRAVLGADEHALAWARGELAFARGDIDQTLAILEPELQTLATMPRLLKHGQAAEQFYRCSLTVADAWVQKGNIEKATETLRAALDRRLRAFRASGVARLSVQSRLAVLERRVGRPAEAAALEAEIAKRLELADPAFVSQLARLAAR